MADLQINNQYDWFKNARMDSNGAMYVTIDGFSGGTGTTGTDTYVTGGTYTNEIITFINNSGGTFNVTGFTSGMTDSYTTGAALSGNSITFNNNVQGSNYFNVDLTPIISGSPFEYNATTITAIQPKLGSNTSSGSYSSIGGGISNNATGDYTSIGGGYGNTANGGYTSIAGGGNNTATGNQSTIAGGYGNTASANSSSIGGGYSNTATGNYSLIGGGKSNAASGSHSLIAGGANNTTNGSYSSIGGGYSNKATGSTSTIAGGANNNANNVNSSIGGGTQNTTSGDGATIGGGGNNSVTSTYSTVAGGGANNISGAKSIIAGGSNNTITGNFATIGGGGSNTANGDKSSIVGGYSNITNHTNSHIIGSNITSVSANTTHVEMLNVKTLNNTTADVSLALDANGFLVSGDTTVFSNWKASADYKGDNIVYTPTNGIVERIADGTSTAQFDATEAANWNFIGGTTNNDALQNGVYYYAGQQIIWNGYITLVRENSGMSTSPSTTELGTWRIVSQAYILAFSPNTLTPNGLTITENGNLYRSNSNHLSLGTFDLDIASWDLIASSGLPQYGIVTTGITEQGIYTAEGTNTTTILYPATGSQDRVMITSTLSGVGTVITVPSGESLNGVVNGTYTTQSDGEAVLFIDNELGKWTTQVVGDSQQTNLFRGKLEKTTTQNIPANTTTALNYSGIVYDTDGSAVSSTNNNIIIPKDGYYKLSANAQTDASTNNAGYNLLLRVDGIVEASQGYNGSVSQVNPSFNCSTSMYLTSGQTVTTAIDYNVNTGTAARTITANGGYNWLIVEELPNSEAVLAGMIQPTTLNYAEWSLLPASTDYTSGGQSFTDNLAINYATGTKLNFSIGNVLSDSSSMISLVNNNITFKKSGKFRIDLSTIFDDVGGTNSSYSNIALGDGTNQLAVFSDDMNTGRICNPTGHYIGTFAENDVIDFRGFQVNGEDTALRAGNISITELPTSAVVNPDFLPVKDIAENKWTTIANNSTNLLGVTSVLSFDSFSDSINSGNIATFDGTNIVITAGINDIKLESIISTNGTGAHSENIYFRDASDTIGLLYGDGSDLSGVSSIGVYGQASVVTPATAIVKAGTNVTLNLVYRASANSQVIQEGSYISVKEIVGQSTVINTTDTPTNDQATSGYFDIGNMRMQWGTDAAVGGIISFPVAFGGIPSVTTNVNTTNTDRISSAASTTTTGFVLTTFNTGTNTASDIGELCDWQAIGLKP